MPTVILKTAHTHAGQEYPPGTLLDVTEPEVAWLAEQGVIEHSDKKAAKPAPNRKPTSKEVTDNG